LLKYQSERDKKETKILEIWEFKVIRFKNDEIENHMSTVNERIMEELAD